MLVCIQCVVRECVCVCESVYVGACEYACLCLFEIIFFGRAKVGGQCEGIE